MADSRTDEYPACDEETRRRVVPFVSMLTGSWLFLVSVLSGCALFQSERYMERFEIKHLNVVLMDEQSIRVKWEEVTRKPSIRYFTIGPDHAIVTTSVRGFFDFETNTIYCPKMNFEVCGHELFHVLCPT
jgi:hypothetical protein